MVIARLILVLAATAPQTPAAADPNQATLADARCIATFAGRLRVDNGPVNTDYNMDPAAYFAGRILSRDPAADLTTLLRQVEPGVRAAPSADAGRCAQEWRSAVTALRAASSINLRGAD